MRCMTPLVFHSHAEAYEMLRKMILKSGKRVMERDGAVECVRLFPFMFGIDLSKAGDPFLFIKERKWGLSTALHEVKWILEHKLRVGDSCILEKAPALAQFKDPDRDWLHAQYGTRIFSSGEQESEEAKIQGLPFGLPAVNQLQALADSLSLDARGRIMPSRRLVVVLWAPWLDTMPGKKDYPCNTQVYFDIRDHQYLDMTITRRSNDIVWGIQNNWVQFFFILQELRRLIKERLKVDLKPGIQYEMLNNLHYYKRHSYGEAYDKARKAALENPITAGEPVGHLFNEGLGLNTNFRYFLEQVTKSLTEKTPLDETSMKQWNKTNLMNYLKKAFPSLTRAPYSR